MLQHVHNYLHPKEIAMVMPDQIADSIRDVLIGNCDCFIPAMIPLQAKAEEMSATQ